MTHSTFQTYFRQHQVPPQWLSVLRAMAVVLEDSIEPEALKGIFFKIGEQMAHSIEAKFAAIETLDDLATEINSHWDTLHWGWITLSELDDAIGIEHHAAPLAEAFGDAALPWSVGLLEGFYQTVFEVLGAGDTMRIETVHEHVSDMLIPLRFGQPHV